MVESTSLVGTPTCVGSPSSESTLSHDWQLDMSAMHHVTPHREWFSIFFALRQDGIHDVGDIRLQFANGSVLVLHDVHFMPNAYRSVISML